MSTVKNFSDLLFSSRTIGALNECAGQNNESLIKYDAETESVTVDVTNNKNPSNNRTTGLANWLKRNFSPSVERNRSFFERFENVYVVR